MYPQYNRQINYLNIILIALSGIFFLTKEWLPLGPARSLMTNYLFIFLIVITLLAFFTLIIYYYKSILRWAIYHTKLIIVIPIILILFGLLTWIGFNSMFGFIANGFQAVNIELRETNPWKGLDKTFPGIGSEFMPSLDEGAFLLMPTSMPHADIQENKQILQKMDMAVENIPEIKSVVGKLGRVQSSLDPAPISMYENIINYKSEYKTDEEGRRIRYAVNKDG